MLISIVTITYNNPAGLEITYESVRDLIRETSPGKYQFEWVVIDGGSSLTGQYLPLYEAVKTAASVFVSEPDEGIYPAMNKGIELSSGDYLWFLNSGDVATDGILKVEMNGEFSVGPPDMIWGLARYRMPGGELVDVTNHDASFIKFSNPVCHQAILFSARVLGSEPYNEEYVSAGDYELIARLIQKNCRIVLSDNIFCIYDSVGTSSRNAWLSMKESNRVRHDVLGMTWLSAGIFGGLKLIYVVVSKWFPAVKVHYRKR